MNFVLNRRGYPTLYLSLEHREEYLDVVAEGNKGNHRPIFDFMCDVYIKQSKVILDEYIAKLRKKKLKHSRNGKTY